MSHRVETFLTRLDRFVWRGWVLLLCASLTTFPAGVSAQTGCSAYNQCPALQGTSDRKLSGPITYSFDSASLTLLSSDATRQDFVNRVKATAADWAARTGVSIAPAPPGQAGNVTVRVEDDTRTKNEKGYVDFDPPGNTSSTRRVMGFSSNWGSWSDAGKDRLTSHEWGHVLGLSDVEDGQCLGVETIMRQLGPTQADSEVQLLQGYTCESSSSTTFGDPNGCPANQKLPQPPSPNACDICAAKNKQAGLPLGSSCAAPTPPPPPSGSECPASSIAPCSTDEYSPNPDGGPTGPPAQCCDYSPILIDLQGDGFSLTDPHNGVYFDFNGDGVRGLFSWTSAGSDDAWLTLDRNGNSLIDDASELFGNYTEQPPSATPNGFLALAEFDRAERGGNSDGAVDASDEVFARLRLWRDANHDGVSNAEELHALPSLGVTGIGLEYREAGRRDRWGNEFRYRARVYIGGGSGRWAYDVFLRPR